MLPRNSSNWDDSIVETNKVWLTGYWIPQRKKHATEVIYIRRPSPSMYVLNTYSYSSHIRSSDFPQQAKIVRCYVENSSYISSRIFDNVIAKWTFCVQQFFSTKNYLQSSHYHVKTKSAAIFFFLLLLSFSSLFLFLLSFSFFTVILELLGLKKPAFWRPFSQMTANFVGLDFKKSATYIWFLIRSFLHPSLPLHY